MRLACVSLMVVLTAMGAAAEPSALVGTDFSAWRGDTGTWLQVGDASLDPANEKKLTSKAGTGAALNGPDGHTAHLISKKEWGDVVVSLDFMVPKKSNSGVYLQGRYEIQVLDSWGVEEVGHYDCGGIYQRYDDAKPEGERGYEGVPPKVNASKKPGEWQHFKISFRAPRFDASGKKIAPAAFIKVMHNGKKVHGYTELTGPTRASRFNDEKALGPLMLQGDHGPVAYRNIVVTPKDFRKTIRTKK
jgi:hypothetical protein